MTILEVNVNNQIYKYDLGQSDDSENIIRLWSTYLSDQTRFDIFYSIITLLYKLNNNVSVKATHAICTLAYQYELKQNPINYINLFSLSNSTLSIIVYRKMEYKFKFASKWRQLTSEYGKMIEPLLKQPISDEMLNKLQLAGIAIVKTDKNITNENHGDRVVKIYNANNIDNILPSSSSTSSKTSSSQSTSSSA
jgi:hypothetical protein